MVFLCICHTKYGKCLNCKPANLITGWWCGKQVGGKKQKKKCKHCDDGNDMNETHPHSDKNQQIRKGNLTWKREIKTKKKIKLNLKKKKRKQKSNVKLYLHYKLQ